MLTNACQNALESYQYVAYCQAEATGAGFSDFAREKCGRRVEYIAWLRKQESREDAKQLAARFVES